LVRLQHIPGESATTSWGEQASIRALRLDADNNFCILDDRAPAWFGPPLTDEEIERLTASEQLVDTDERVSSSD